MKIKTRCECGKTLVTSTAFAGKKIRCPACQKVVKIPSAEGQDIHSSTLDAGTSLEFLSQPDFPTKAEDQFPWFGDDGTSESTSPPDDANATHESHVAVPDAVQVSQQVSESKLAETAVPDVTGTDHEQKKRSPFLPLPRRITIGIGACFAGLAFCFVILNSVSGRRELKTEEIVRRFESSVAFIKGRRGSGSGFTIAPGLVVTNAHVLQDEFLDSIEVHFPSAALAARGPFTATLVYKDAPRDLAILSIKTQSIPLHLAESFKFRRGQDITVIGSPGVGDRVLQNAVSKGVMSTETTLDSHTFYQLGISINAGNSGGPVFDSFGDVVGVLTARAANQEALAFCVPLDDVRNSLQVALKAGKNEMADTASKHRCDVATRRIAKASRLYLLAMNSYTDSMDSAIKARKSADDGLVVARLALQDQLKVVNVTLLEEVQPLVPSVASDPRLSEVVRTKFVDLWTTFSEIKGYVDNPRGNFLTYRTKLSELSDSFDRSREALRVSLGFDEL